LAADSSYSAAFALMSALSVLALALLAGARPRSSGGALGTKLSE
jgi:hypothetical protein